MDIFKRMLIALMVVFACVTVGGAAALPLHAQSPEESACTGSGGTWDPGSKSCAQGGRTVTGTIKSVGNILVFVTGAVSVLMIIIGGLRYTLSAGDQGSITSAKNTILYAVVGIIVSIAAFAIINFVIKNV